VDQDCWSNLVAKTARRLTRAGGQGRLTTCRGISLCPVRRRVDRSTRADRSQYAMVYEIDRRFHRELGKAKGGGATEQGRDSRR